MPNLPLIITRTFLPCILFCGLFFEVAHAQVRPSLGEGSRLMNGAISEMEKGNYEKANVFFRQIIEKSLPIPPEMPYFFAKTLFEIGQYDNSQNFLNKYIEINGTRGENYANARELQKHLAKPLQAIKDCQLCDKRGYRIEICPTCTGKKQIEQSCLYCRGKGIVGCNRCMGKGLVTVRNIFNIVEYHECDKCSGQGKHTCPKCEGNLKEFSECRTCQGVGTLSTENLCNHQPQPRHISMVFESLRGHKHP